MFDRLKSLPLTIVLTILIWMYAESQVTSQGVSVQVTVKNVPVWVSGPPDILARYDITVDPTSVDVKVSGLPQKIDPLRPHLEAGGTFAGIYAYLDITPEDRPSPPPNNFRRRALRFMAPDGLTVSDPPEAAFQMIEHAPSTQPAK